MSPSKILVIKVRALGDSVLMSAPLLELIKAHPQAKIHLVISPQWKDLYLNFPGIIKIWTFNRSNNSLVRTRSLAKLSYHLRKENFDWVVNLHASPSTSTLSRATGAKVRSVHFHGHTQKNRFSTVTVPGKGTLKPIIERDMDALRGMGLSILSGKMPKLFLNPTEKEKAKEVLQKMELHRPLLGLNLGASRPTKSWPLERFVTLALDWAQKTSGSSLAFIGPGEEQLRTLFYQLRDQQLEERFSKANERSNFRNRIDCVSDLSIRQLMAMISECQVFVGNDSGPRHIAAALDVPTATLFGPENPFEWHPYPTDRHPYFFVEGLNCRTHADPGMPAWCGLEKCTEFQHQCMKLLGTDAVLQSCLNFL